MENSGGGRWAYIGKRWGGEERGGCWVSASWAGLVVGELTLRSALGWTCQPCPDARHVGHQSWLPHPGSSSRVAWLAVCRPRKPPCGAQEENRPARPTDRRPGTRAPVLVGGECRSGFGVVGEGWFACRVDAGWQPNARSSIGQSVRSVWSPSPRPRLYGLHVQTALQLQIDPRDGPRRCKRPCLSEDTDGNWPGCSLQVQFVPDARIVRISTDVKYYSRPKRWNLLGSFAGNFCFRRHLLGNASAGLEEMPNKRSRTLKVKLPHSILVATKKLAHHNRASKESNAIQMCHVVHAALFSPMP